MIFGVIVIAIASLIAVPKIVKNNRIRNEIKPAVEKWEKKADFLAHVQGAPCAAFGQVIDPNCAEPSIINAGEMIL